MGKFVCRGGQTGPHVRGYIDASNFDGFLVKRAAPPAPNSREPRYRRSGELAVSLVCRPAAIPILFAME
jgi:hypothetical protein